MSILEFLLLLLIAGICGSLAQNMVGYTHGGCLVSVVLGFIGAMLGTWLAHAIGLPEIFTVSVDGKAFPIVWSIIGAALFVAVLAMISGRHRRQFPE